MVGWTLNSEHVHMNTITLKWTNVLTELETAGRFWVERSAYIGQGKHICIYNNGAKTCLINTPQHSECV